MGERTLKPSFLSVPGDARFPYQAKPRFEHSMAFEPSATNPQRGKMPIRSH